MSGLEDEVSSLSKAARLLSVLVASPESDLEGYRRRMLGKSNEVPVERLAAMREALLALGATLLDADDEAWERVIAARDALRPGQGPSLAEVTEAASTGSKEETPAPPPRAQGPMPGHTGFTGRIAEVHKPSVWASTAPAPPAAGSWSASTAGKPGSAPPTSVARPAPPPPLSPSARTKPLAPPSPAVASEIPAPALQREAGVLPFQPGPARPPPKTASEKEELHPELGSTVGVEAISPLLGKELFPFRKQSAGDEPQPVKPTLTLEQYASLCATCAESPENTYQTHQHYGIASPAVRAQLDAAFAARFEKDPAEKAKFDVFVNRYRAWIQKNKP